SSMPSWPRSSAIRDRARSSCRRSPMPASRPNLQAHDGREIMRTNPFLDAWLFLIGQTDDHNALGWVKYGMGPLVLVLLAASAWIAIVNWGQDADQRTGARLATFACRVLIGSMWFQGCLWKLPLPVSGGFRYWTGQMTDNAAFEFHRALVKNVYLPYLQFIDPLVFLAEISFATTLLLGFGVRLFAFFAVFLLLYLWS